MKMTKQTLFIALGALVAATAITAGSVYVYRLNQPVSTNTTTVSQVKSTESPSLASTDTTQQLLLYLIEEEKLAHDVYTVMYQKYGANVFGNILKSETTHQAKVLTLLQARNIVDPRSSEIGVFTNKELQELYDSLIEQGNTSATEAYKVGVAIEEKDIADISAQLATATDDDVITTLEALRSASENHLRAFNRQL
jgi:hypothetical protein